MSFPFSLAQKWPKNVPFRNAAVIRLPKYLRECGAGRGDGTKLVQRAAGQNRSTPRVIDITSDHRTVGRHCPGTDNRLGAIAADRRPGQPI